MIVLAALLAKSLHIGLGLVTSRLSFGLKGVAQRAKKRGLEFPCLRQKNCLSLKKLSKVPNTPKFDCFVNFSEIEHEILPKLSGNLSKGDIFW